MRRAPLLMLLSVAGCFEVNLRFIGDPPPPPPAADPDTGTAQIEPTTVDPAEPSGVQQDYELPLAESMDACATSSSSFELELAWEWTSWADDPRVRHVRTTPQLGDIDGDGALDVVFIAVADDGADQSDVLFALDGRTGDQILAVPDVYGYATRFAVVDLDGDDQDEIIVTSKGNVVALDVQGTRWVHAPERDCASHLLPGDFDDDGDVELATACGMLDGATGTLLAEEPSCARTAFDADGDGTIELFCDQTVHDNLGTVIAELERPSLGVIPRAGGGFLVKTEEGIDTYDVSLQRVGSTPTLLEPSLLAACTADADADGHAEVFLPLEADLTAWTLDGPHRWSTHRPPVEGSSGARTCVAVDLDADGCTEVIWPQNGAPHIHDATTGAPRGTLDLGEANTTRLQPLPIHDLDGDGSLDIVINGSALGEPDTHWTGIRVVREAHGAWVGEAPPLLLTGARSGQD